MLISDQFEVAVPLEQAWRFFDDIHRVADCLPGAELTEDLGDDKYRGAVRVSMGPVSLTFDGTAQVTERDHSAKLLVLEANGSEAKGKGTAAMLVTASLSGSDGQTTVDVTQDLDVSGAAAQYGKGMIADVTSVLMHQFAANMATELGAHGSSGGAHRGQRAPARGLGLGLAAAMLALRRVFRRFFAPGVG